MNQKYTPASAIAIKRDIQKSQMRLKNLNREIEEKWAEKREIDAVLDQKRGLVQQLEEVIAEAFTRKETEQKAQQKKMIQLEMIISKMETARELLQAEISLKKQEVKEPAGANLMRSVIAELGQTLDSLMNQIGISEQELERIEVKKQEFIEANKQLEKEAEVQEKAVEVKRTELEEADRRRQKILKEMAEESQKLKLIRQRERDSEAMNRRLSAEYQEVYQSLPRRNLK